jgi:hypothetical protein
LLGVVSELPDEAQDLAWGFDIFEEEVVDKQVEEEEATGLVVSEGEGQVNEVSDSAFLVLVIEFIEHLAGEFVEVDHHLELIEVDEAGAHGVDEVDEQQHALLGGDFDQIVDILADSEDGADGEQREGGEALVAEELEEELVALAAALHDDGLEQLHVVLDGVLPLPVDAQLLKQVLVDYRLREDVDEVVGRAAVRDQQVEEL